MDFPKKYTHQSIQQELLTRQKRNKLFGSKTIKKSGEKWTITLLSWPILVAPVITSYSQLLQTIKEDCMARYFRMLGKQANYSPRFGYQTGNEQWDEKKHNNTQRSKDIEKQKNKRIRQMIRLGIGFDEKECLSLLSPITTRKLRNTIDYYMQQWRIKDDMAINYRSNKRQTNISPEEISRKRTKGKIYNIRYFVDTKNITVVVWTNSPETIFGDVALAVHPEDKRYKKLIGHKVIIPVINKTIPVIGDETIDITKNNGVMRVSPCHDTRGLQIAQKHNLKTNTFAIDHNGCFTKLAGDFGEKKVADFLGNILQNLEDIHNLESVHQEEFEIPTDKTSGEKLQPILSQQRFFVVPESPTQTAWEEKIFQDINIQPTMYHDLWRKTADNQTNIHRPISQKDSIGIALPVRENEEDSYFVGEYDIINASGRKAKGKKIIPTLLLFNLIADGQLPTLFNIENLIELMLAPGAEGQNVWELYMQAFEEDLPRGYKSEINEFIKLFEYAETDLIKGKSLTNYEKFSIQLTDILDKTFGLVNKKVGRYYFDAATIMGSKAEITASAEKCESSLATSIILLQQSGILNALQAERTIFLGTEKEKNTIIKTNILGKLKTGYTPLQDIFLFPEDKPCKAELREELVQQRWSDNIRLQSITQDMREINRLTNEEAEKHAALLNKIWNACRYVRANFIDLQKRKKDEERDLQEIWAYLEKRISKMDSNEYRMLCRIKDLYAEIPDCLDKNNISQLSAKAIECIKKDFCDKYLEIIKVRNSDITDKVAIFCVGMFLQILHPVIPFLTEKIWNLFGFTWYIGNQKYTSFLEKSTKNYKTQLFMDIIDKFTALREKTGQAKHQKVDICFHASMDFIHYIKENEDIVTKLINTDQINYVDNEKNLASYETDSIIDVTIGLRIIGKPIKVVANKEIRSKELIKKQEKLQEIRSLTSKLSLDKKNKRLIEKKKEEMQELKKEIEKLEFEIKKSKMNEK